MGINKKGDEGKNKKRGKPEDPREDNHLRLRTPMMSFHAPTTLASTSLARPPRTNHSNFSQFLFQVIHVLLFQTLPNPKKYNDSVAKVRIASLDPHPKKPPFVVKISRIC